MRRFSHVGIVGYGSYVPEGRVTVNSGSLCVKTKAVAGVDEDAATLAWEAATAAIDMARVKAEVNISDAFCNFHHPQSFAAGGNGFL